MLQILLLACISLITCLCIRKLSVQIKLEKQIFYLILGIFIGICLQYTPYQNITNLFPRISQYNMFSLLFMFFIAGFTINIKQIKQSGSLTPKLFTFPVYVETLIMSIIIYYSCILLPSIGFHLQFPEAIIIAGIFATASPSNTIPICARMIQKGYTDKNNIPSIMISASIIDGFITIPIVFSAIFILLSTSLGTSIHLLNILKIIILSIIGILFSIGIGIVLGKILIMISKPLFKKFHNTKEFLYKNDFIILSTFAMAILLTYLLYQFQALKSIIALFGILMMCGIGLSIHYFDKTEVHNIIKNKGNQLFDLFGMPIIFIYVGASIDIQALLNLKTLLFFTTITILAITIKTLTTKFILRDQQYTSGEKKFAMACFIPKGVGLINFSVLFGTILNPQSMLLNFMTTLAAISIIFSMSIGIPIINKSPDHYIMKKQ